MPTEGRTRVGGVAGRERVSSLARAAQRVFCSRPQSSVFNFQPPQKIMKKLSLLSLCVALGLLLPGCGDSSAKTPEDLGKVVLMSLKKNDKDLYEKYVADYSDAMAAVSTALSELDENRRAEREEAEEMLKSGDFKVKVERSRVENLRSWSSVREEGESDGVEWKDAKFVTAEWKLGDRNGVKGASDILVTFKSEGQIYVFEVDKAVDCGGKWKSTDELHWRGER